MRVGERRGTCWAVSRVRVVRRRREWFNSEFDFILQECGSV